MASQSKNIAELLNQLNPATITGIQNIEGSPNGSLVINDLLVINDQALINTSVRSQAALTTNGTIDVSTSNFWICNCVSDLTFSFSNVPSDADVVSVILQLHNAGNYVMTFPTSVKWGGGSAPSFTASGSDLLGFISNDSGTSWRGIVLNINSAIPFTDPT